MNDTEIFKRDWFIIWYQEIQVSCDRNYLSQSNYFSWWYQDKSHEDESNYWLKEFSKYSWYIIISWFCEFLLIIYKIFLKDYIISYELD